ncbi:MAG TPA: OmpH family outer membrane protein [Burkholderiales bacterium]|jgi:outer membrane protein|nr:OmpH family outer membrane protein [Burkholderiales bacterium]
MVRNFLLLAAAAVFAAPVGSALAQSKIGVVQIERIVRDSAPAVRAQKKLEAEFAKREAELAKVSDQLKRMQDELEKDGVTMSETVRRNKERDFNDQSREFQRKQREYREDVNQRRNEELAQVIDQANRVIRQIAEAEKYDIVFQEAAYANPRIDITDKVIKAMENKPPAAPAK